MTGGSGILPLALWGIGKGAHFIMADSGTNIVMSCIHVAIMFVTSFFFFPAASFFTELFSVHGYVFFILLPKGIEAWLAVFGVNSGIALILSMLPFPARRITTNKF